MAAGYFNGGAYGPGANFDDGNVFEGCTFIAPCTFGEGCTFINCTWECNRNCKRGPCRCCGDISEVGPGAVAVDCKGDHVKFEPTGTTKNFVDTGCTSLVLPNCVDCAPRPAATNGSGISTTGTELVVSDRGVVTQSDWCKECGRMGAVIQPDKAELAPDK